MIESRIVAKSDNPECNITITLPKEKPMYHVKLMLKSFGWKIGDKLSFCSNYCKMKYNIKNNITEEND